MHLFSISCTTCQQRLKVHDAAAIGQILICPKCGSMVLVEPPPDWVSHVAGQDDEDQATVEMEGSLFAGAHPPPLPHGDTPEPPQPRSRCLPAAAASPTPRTCAAPPRGAENRRRLRSLGARREFLRRNHRPALRPARPR